MHTARMLCAAFLALAGVGVAPALAADDPKDASAHRAAMLSADGRSSDQDEKPGERGGPPNDDCALALAVTCGSSTIFDNSTYTTDPSDPPFSCDGDVLPQLYSAWFTFVATGTQATVSTCNPGTVVQDTRVAVYSGSCGNLTEIACNDDAIGDNDGCGPIRSQSRVLATGLTPGQTYLVQVDGATYAGYQPGQIELTIDCNANIDDCARALPVPGNSSLTFQNAFCTTDIADPAFSCHIGGPQQGFFTAWFTFVADGTQAELSLCNPGTLVNDTLLAVYTGSCGNLTEIACNDDAGPGCGSSGYLSRLTATGLTYGQTYFVQVAGRNSSAAGQIELTIACSTPFDDCAFALPLSCGTSFMFNITPLANPRDPSAPYGCSPTAFMDAWFTFVATGTQAEISLCNPGTSIPGTSHSVFFGSCGNFTEIACNDFGGAGCGPEGRQSRLTATGLTPGQTYYIRVYPDRDFPLAWAELTIDCFTPILDCNANGIDDAADIQAGTSHDCFNASAAPNSAGGPNGVPDECECLPDWNRDGTSNSTDVSDFVNTYFADQTSGGLDGDVNCDGVSNSTDVSDFINIWFAAQAGQLPFAGCTI